MWSSEIVQETVNGLLQGWNGYPSLMELAKISLKHESLPIGYLKHDCPGLAAQNRTKEEKAAEENSLSYSV